MGSSSLERSQRVDLEMSLSDHMRLVEAGIWGLILL